MAIKACHVCLHYAGRLNSGVRHHMEDSRPLLDRMHPVLAAVALPVIVLAAIVVKLVTMPFERPATRSRLDVSEILKRRISDNPDWMEWDEFLCVPIADSELEAIREECAALEVRAYVGGPPTYLNDDAQAKLRELVAKADGA